MTDTYSRMVVTRFGGPEVLKLERTPRPSPKLGELRLQVLAAGVSFADVLMREGVHPERRPPPFTPGWDVVGRIEALGAGVTGWAIGDLAAALVIRGGYSECLCLSAAECIPVPSALDPAEAACLVMDYVVAYQMLHRLAQVKDGDRILTHGAAGSVGTALLQLGRLAGLEQYGTASAAKQAHIAQHGAVPIDYRSEDFVTRIAVLTGSGVDAVFDGIGGLHLLRSYRALQPGGCLVAYGLSGMTHGGRGEARRVLEGLLGFTLAFGTNLLPLRRRTLLYSIQTLKRRHPLWYQQDLSHLFALLAARQIAPVIAARLPLEGAAHAHELLGQGQVIGKMVLMMG